MTSRARNSGNFAPDGAIWNLSDATALAGRVCIAALFLPSGISKIVAFTGISGFIASRGLPAPSVLAAMVIALELAGSVALLVGIRTRAFAFSLAAFTILAGLLFHNYWDASAAQAMLQKQAFFKNVAIVGGLLVLGGFGAGRFSFDARRPR